MSTGCQLSCGCKFFHDDPGGWSLDFCPLHGAAPDLLAACKLAKERLDKMGMDWLGKGPDPLEAAIAKAEAA
jgi:hypothetical protein